MHETVSKVEAQVKVQRATCGFSQLLTRYHQLVRGGPKAQERHRQLKSRAPSCVRALLYVLQSAVDDPRQLLKRLDSRVNRLQSLVVPGRYALILLKLLACVRYLFVRQIKQVL